MPTVVIVTCPRKNRIIEWHIYEDDFNKHITSKKVKCIWCDWEAHSCRVERKITHDDDELSIAQSYIWDLHQNGDPASNNN